MIEMPAKVNSVWLTTGRLVIKKGPSKEVIPDLPIRLATSSSIAFDCLSRKIQVYGVERMLDIQISARKDCSA